VKHPLHPALVHFPVATWSLASIGDVAGLAWQWSPLQPFAGACMAIGVLAALAAMATGFMDFLKLPLDSPVARDARRHALSVGIAWTCYFTSLLLRLDGSTLIAPGMAAIALSAAGFIALCIGGWMGGKLVYVHGANVHRWLA
jgi:uncharacterized membrane protein